MRQKGLPADKSMEGLKADARSPNVILHVLNALTHLRERAPWWSGVFGGLILVAIGALVRLAILGPNSEKTAYLTFWPAVMVAALVGGVPAGATVVILSAILVHTAFVPLRDSADWLGLTVFLVGGGVIVGVTELFLRTRSQALAAIETQSVKSHLAAIVESSDDAILSKDLNGTILSWNAAASRLFGYELDEIIGRPITMLFPPHLVGEEKEIVAKLKNGERIEHFETSRVAKSGRVIDVALTISPIRDSRGAVVGASKIIRDISDKKRAEKALRLSQGRLRHAADAARLTYFQFDLKDNWVQLAENFEKVVGYKPRTPPDGGVLEGARMGLLARVAEPDRALVSAMFDDIFAGMGGKHRFRIIGDDGATRWFESVSGPEHNREGRVTRVFATLLDVTSQVDGQTALESAKAKADEILASIADGFYALDSQWRFSYFNPRAEEMLGKTSDDVLGQPFFDVFPMVKGSQVHARYLKVFAEKQPLQFEMISPIMKRWVSFNVYPTHEGGISVYFQDVERQKAAEQALIGAKAEAERANLAKSKFLASASHDLRQPVQSLVLLLSLIERQVKENPTAVETAQLMKQALGGLNSLLTAILDISRLDAGVVQAAPQVVDLAELLGRLTAEYGAKAQAKGLNLRYVPRRLQTFVDPSLLERSLRNLIENALRYTVEGAVLIGARGFGERVRIDVIDTGIGIPQDRQADIFEEFVQVDNPGRDLGLGLGLGLAIVARLSALMGSKVEIDSKLGQGSRFSLWLPRIQAAAAAISAADRDIRDAGGRLLLVEDNAILRETLAGMARAWGYDTIVVGSGEEGLKQAKAAEWRIDGVVSDHRLGPGLTGVETGKEIRRLAGRVIPTLILTGDTAAERISEITSSGFELLHKPVSAEALRCKIAAMMVNRS